MRQAGIGVYMYMYLIASPIERMTKTVLILFSGEFVIIFPMKLSALCVCRCDLRFIFAFCQFRFHHFEKSIGLMAKFIFFEHCGFGFLYRNYVCVNYWCDYKTHFFGIKAISNWGLHNIPCLVFDGIEH